MYNNLTSRLCVRTEYDVAAVVYINATQGDMSISMITNDIYVH
jgi:hypothetical protein